MKTLKGEYTYTREEKNELAKMAFQFAMFQPNNADYTLEFPAMGTVKEFKYIKEDKVVRFLIFDRTKPEGGSYMFQYQVFQATEEEIQDELQNYEKRISDSLLEKEEVVTKKKEITNVEKKPVEQPIMVEEVETPEVVLEPEAEEVEDADVMSEHLIQDEQTRNTLEAWGTMNLDFEEEEESGFFAEVSQEELEALGQETLALF